MNADARALFRRPAATRKSRRGRRRWVCEHETLLRSFAQRPCKRSLGFVFVLALVACAPPPTPQTRPLETSHAAPSALPSTPQPVGLVDLHVDLPYALYAKHRALEDVQSSPSRLARGGLSVIVTPLFVSHAFTMRPDEARLAYAQTYDALRLALPHLGAEAWLSFEGADGFADDVRAIDPWLERGACLVALVHDHTNALGGASQDPSPAARAQGLTDAGKKLAEHVLSRGGLIDVSHASDATFDGLAPIVAAAHAPLVASHTGMRALRETMRNVDDSRLRVIAASNGIAGISMHGGHVGKVPGEHPTMDDFVAAVLHAVAVGGVEHVAIGSDFDGGIDPPAEADGESVWPLVRAALVSHGVDAHAIDAIFSGNARRVFSWARDHGCTPGAR